MGRIIGVLEANGVHLSAEPRRQIVALEDQFATTEQEMTALKAENLKLKAQNEPLQREIDWLKKKLELKEGLHLSELENEILKHLCRPDPHTGPRVENFLAVVARGVQTNETRTRVFLVKLMQ